MIRAKLFEGAAFPHGFETREDDASGLAASGPRADRLFFAKQVHGRDVHTVRPGDEPSHVRGIRVDALVATGAGDGVGVVTADCAPVLVADRHLGRVAAVHAGWRGVVRGVLGAALDVLVASGSRPEDLIAALGPHIRVCCFEVGEDVAADLEAVGALVDRSRPRPHVDLSAALVRTLSQRGASAWEDVGGCTYCEPERFHSHRRDGPRAGRQRSLVVARRASGPGGRRNPANP